MVRVPRSFRDMPRWWHDEPGRRWLDDLPELVQDRCLRWDLTVDGPPAHGSNALVVPVVRHGTPLALRLAPPGDDVAAPARALRLWDGRGAVVLHDVDVAHRVMLLERLDPHRSLVTHPLTDGVRILAELVTVLAVPVPDDVADDVPSTREIAVAVVGSIEGDLRAAGDPLPGALVARVLAHGRDLAAAAGDQGRAVDGDLHFGQVLRGTRAPWLVVDPLLLRGDPEHDVGRVLWSRLDEIATERELRSLFELFAATAGVPRERARSWVVVRAASYLVWGLRHGLTWDPPRCRRLLETFA